MSNILGPVFFLRRARKVVFLGLGVTEVIQNTQAKLALRYIDCFFDGASKMRI